MSRIAVLGANGQVGAELCLMWSGRDDLEVVPIARNRSGSAFLRWRGVRCRHGRTSDPSEAASLYGDCDVVLNLARPWGRPREALRINDRLLANSAAGSRPGAKLIYVSSLSIHPQFRPVTSPAVRSAYSREKRAVERLAARHAARAGKPCWILRPGHVAGELQHITADIRRLLAAGPIVLPWGGDQPACLTHVVTIADAVLRILDGTIPPGTYDLVNEPNWTWREVIDHEARTCGVTPIVRTPHPEVPRSYPRWPARAVAGARRGVRTILASPRFREIGLSALARMPASWNLRAQVQHFRRRAAAEIAELTRRPPSYGAFAFAPAGSKFPPGLTPTEELLRHPSFQVPGVAGPAFPPDLPPAV